VIKTAVQSLYNSLKGGLDANMQQVQAIQPPVKTRFKQKYLIRLLLSIVMNAWRAQQLLQQPVYPDNNFSFYSYRKLLVNQCASLKDFNYRLVMALIQSSADPYFQNILGAHLNRTVNVARNESNLDAQLGIARDPATLVNCIQTEKWPKKHCYCGFTNRKNLLELRLTQNDEFKHILTKMNSKKMHCALCVIGKTMCGCSICKVALCKTSKDELHKNENCFMIWYKHVDLILEHIGDHVEIPMELHKPIKAVVMKTKKL
jgi:hypothetical protein